MGTFSTLQVVTSPSAAVPPLPGQQYTVSPARSIGDCDTFHASACSRPPPPITMTSLPNSLRFRFAATRVHPIAAPANTPSGAYPEAMLAGQAYFSRGMLPNLQSTNHSLKRAVSTEYFGSEFQECPKRSLPLTTILRSLSKYLNEPNSVIGRYKRCCGSDRSNRSLYWPFSHDGA